MADLFIQQFENVSKGATKYITLDSLQVGLPYQVLGFRLLDGQYGRCLIADLPDGFGVILVKRIADVVKSEEHLNQLNSKKYLMIFKGRHHEYRKMAIIEFKTMEQLEQEAALENFGIPIATYTLVPKATQTDFSLEVNEQTGGEDKKKPLIKFKKEKKPNM